MPLQLQAKSSTCLFAIRHSAIAATFGLIAAGTLRYASTHLRPRSQAPVTERPIALPPIRQESALDLKVHSPNQLLASLRATDFELLRPHLRTIELAHRVVLIRAGEPLTQVYFPHGGIISLVVSLAGGETIEAAMIGRDSVFGSAAALDGAIALNDAIVQLPGGASILDIAHLRRAAEKSVDFRTTLIRHEQALFAQAQQSAACNATHSVEARLSRWLLRARDLWGSDALPLTQEFLAQMLGVQRSSVSVVANTLQQSGLIRYHRGQIDIVDLQGLMESSCECYATVKAHYDRLLGSD
jgi:CRP-like cAMP-binding protein